MASLKRHKITYAELTEGKHFTDYAEEYAFIKELLDSGRLRAHKSCRTNGRKPALPTLFWIVEELPDASVYEDELRFNTVTYINIDYYLKYPTVYVRERKWVRMLNDYLMKDPLEKPVSLNELSYTIWKREKFLSGIKKEDGVSGKDIIKHCGLSLKDFDIYETAEPLAYYSFNKTTPQKLLILENLDPFYGMRKQLAEGNPSILGEEFGTLIYGGGKRVTRAFSDFEILSEAYMLADGNELLYFGDLDYEGIGIFENFSQHMKDIKTIEPFLAAYRRMLEKSGDIEQLPDMKSGQHKCEGELFYSFFEDQEVSFMKEILSAGKYIPQECLNIKDYNAI